MYPINKRNKIPPIMGAYDANVRYFKVIRNIQGCIFQISIESKAHCVKLGTSFGLMTVKIL